MSEAARFPIGRFVKPEIVSAADRAGFLDRIQTTPKRLRAAAGDLTPKQLDTPYREGGWTARQVIHHLPDSHMQAYSRLKMALTEDCPAIKPYEEGEWAKLPDTFVVPVETSLVLLECLHERWMALFNNMTEPQWKRTFQHPKMGPLALEVLLALYAWHGDHHIAHVKIVAGL